LTYKLLSSSFSDLVASTLTSLELADTELAPDPPCFVQLRCLRFLWGVSGLAHLPQLLQGCHGLEELVFHDKYLLDLTHHGSMIELPHLHVLVAPMQYLNALLAMLSPGPPCSVIISNPAGIDWISGDRGLQTLQAAAQWLSIDRLASNTLLYHAAPPPGWNGAKWYTLEVRDGAGRTGYVDHARRLSGLSGVLGATRRLHVRGTAFGSLVCHAVACPAALTGLAKLIVEAAESRQSGQETLRDLESWLSARARGGLMLDELNFVGYERSALSFGPFQAIAEMVEKTNAVRELHQDGQLVYSLGNDAVEPEN
jgi:hypothetical protein